MDSASGRHQDSDSGICLCVPLAFAVFAHEPGTKEGREAGERPGSACAIEVEGLKRRPRVEGLGFGV